MAGDILKTTKIEIRSVLLSFPIGVTYKQLNSEYHMRIGREIPVTQCGYDRLDQLLRDMPDVVRTEYDRNSGTTKLYGVADETTLHIDRMVASQKVCITTSFISMILSFVIDKCKTLHMGSNNMYQVYIMNGQNLEEVIISKGLCSNIQLRLESVTAVHSSIQQGLQNARTN